MDRPACLLPLLFAAIAACGASPTSPASAGPLQMTASATKTTLSAGESTIVTFTLRNLTKQSVRIDLPDSCLVQPHVLDTTTGKELSGFGFVCATVVTTVTLAPEEVRNIAYPLRAGDAAGSLRAGTYHVHATLNDRVYQTTSEPITITVNGA